MELSEQYQLFLLDGLNCNKNTSHGKIFMDMLAMRISGYHRFYGNKLMPIDLYDHFGTHLVLCKKGSAGENMLVSCVRSIDYSGCETNGVDFLPIARVTTYNPGLVEEIKILINKNKGLSYDSGLTINPLIVSSTETYQILKYMIGAALNYHRYRKSKAFLVSAITKTKTDRLFLKVGFKPICSNANYKLKGMENDDFVMMRYTEDNIFSRGLIKEAKYLWENRLEMSSVDNCERYTVAVS